MPDYNQQDEEFELLWNAVESIWKTGDKRDAKYFWLKGREKELFERQLELDRLRREVESVR